MKSKYITLVTDNLHDLLLISYMISKVNLHNNQDGIPSRVLRGIGFAVHHTFLEETGRASGHRR